MSEEGREKIETSYQWQICDNTNLLEFISRPEVRPRFTVGNFRARGPNYIRHTFGSILDPFAVLYCIAPFLAFDCWKNNETRLVVWLCSEFEGEHAIARKELCGLVRYLTYLSILYSSLPSKENGPPHDDEKM